MFADSIWVAVSLVLLTGGAELLVRGSAALALRFGLSSFFVGLTIVGFGTSTPELATSISAALNELPEISLGNVVGSNIFNVAMILGLTALIAPIPVNTRAVTRQILIMIGVSFVPFLAWFADGVLTRPMGVAMLAGLVAFLVYGYRVGKSDAAADAPILEELEVELGVQKGRLFDRVSVCVIAIAVGLALLVFGARLLVDSSVSIARAVGISELAIGLTIVAAGTSMPELFTSAVAAARKQSDIAVGNIVGSNIFNILGIAGITAIVYPQTVGRELMLLHIPIMAVLSLAALPIMLSGARVSRGEGAVLLACYGAYLIVLLQFAPRWFS